MQLEDAKLTSDAPKSKVVVICHAADYAAATACLNAFAPHDWQQHGQLRLLEASSRVRFRQKDGGRTARHIQQRPDSVGRALDDMAPRSEAARILLLGNAAVDVGVPPDDLRTIIPVQTIAELHETLPRVLIAAGVDWFSRVCAILEHYHIAIRREDVAAWREQFQRLNHGWIGDALLKMLEFWPSHGVCDELLRPPHASNMGSEEETLRWLETFDVIAFNKAETGDSSAAVARLAKIRIGRLLQEKRVDFGQHLQTVSAPAKILLLEDCLITATETIRLFDQFAPDLLRKHDISLKFASGTVWGAMRLKCYLRRRNLGNVQLLEPNAGFIPNLTERGISRCTSDTMFDDDLKPIGRSEVIDGIQLRGSGYFNVSQRRNIVSFCKAVGAPLLNLHLQRKGGSPEAAGRRFPDWSLGFDGLGLLLAFGHGVPKPALPLLWIAGETSGELWGGRFRAQWEPLFPPTLAGKFNWS